MTPSFKGLFLTAQKFATWLLPPAITYVLSQAWFVVRKSASRSALFEGEGVQFEHFCRTARVYGEYGLGDSTLWVANNTSATVISVDTDLTWVKKVSAGVRRTGVKLIHVDLGEVGNYGRPLDYSGYDSFYDYFEGPWTQGEKPDVVLVDGRFRVASSLTSVLLCEDDTLIIFDDYVGRKGYHVVERVISPVQISGRQAIFRVRKKTLDLSKVKSLRDSFVACMD